MKSKKEIKKWLLKNCVTAFGLLDLSGLDFSDSKMDVATYGMKVNGNLIQSSQKVKGKVYQHCQEVGGNLYQGFQKVKHDLYQYEQTVKGNIYQDKLKVKMTEEETLEQKIIDVQIENSELKEENAELKEENEELKKLVEDRKW